MHDTRRLALSALLHNLVNKNRIRQRVCGLGKFDKVEMVIHLTMVTRVKHVEPLDEPAVHWAKALCEEVCLNRLIPEVEIPMFSHCG
jgi:hypothetical protein